MKFSGSMFFPLGLVAVVGLAVPQKANATIDVEGKYCGHGWFEIFDQWGNMIGGGVSGGPFNDDGGGGDGDSGGGGGGGGSNNGGDGNYEGVEDILPARLACLVDHYHMQSYGPRYAIKNKLSWAYNSGQGTPIHQYWAEQVPPPAQWNTIVRGTTNYTAHKSFLFNRAFKPTNGGYEGSFFGVHNYSGNMTGEEAALHAALHEAGHQNGLGEPGANYMGNFGVLKYRTENNGSAYQ